MPSYGHAHGHSFVRPLATYLLGGRVLDLTNAIFSSSTTVTDKSGEGNDATLYSGRFASTDGVADKAINANATAEGSANYYLTGKVRPTGTSCRVQINDTASGEDDITGLTTSVWNDFTSATFSSQTPSNIVLGWSNNTGFLAVACDWSDVKLINAATGESSPVARWQLNESTDGDLDQYPALDSSGNGYHGIHTGCAGGTGETTILQTAGMDWNKRMWFGGGSERIELGTGDALSLDGNAKVELRAHIYVSGIAPPTSYNVFSQYINSISSGFGVALSGANVLRVAARSSFTDSFQNFTTAISNGWHKIACYADFANDEFGISIDDAPYLTASATFANSAYTQGTSTEIAAIGDLTASSNTEWNGLLSDVEIYVEDVIEHRWTGYGNTDEHWLDQVGSLDGTVNGSPSNYLITVSDDTPSDDCLGNTISTPRPTADTFNGFGAGEYLQIPDNASLETVRSITVAIYNDGTTRDFVQAAGGASFVHSASNVLTTDQTGTHAYYVNGAGTTTLAAGWNIVGITFDAGKDLSGGKTLYQNAKLLAYDPTALTADQQLQNFNSFKSKFGL